MTDQTQGAPAASQEQAPPPIAPHEIEYTDFMSQNGISPGDLPKEIKNKIQGIKLLDGQFKKKPTEAVKTKIAALDAEICTMIDDWMVEDDQETKKQNNMSKEAEEKAAKEKADKEAADAKAAADAAAAKEKADKEAADREAEETSTYLGRMRRRV